MLNIVYNYLFIFFLIYSTFQTNKYFFNFNNLIFTSSLFFHLFLTVIYILTSLKHLYFYYKNFFFLISILLC